MPVLPDHFSGIFRGGNFPPDLDLYSKSVRGDTPGDGRMVGVQSLVPVSFSPRSDDLTMEADRGRTNEGRGFWFAASASKSDCIRARSRRALKIDNGTKNDGASLNLGDSKTCGRAVAEPVFYFWYQESVIRNPLRSSSRSTYAQNSRDFP